MVKCHYNARVYVEKILLPYIKKKREELRNEPDYPALVLFDGQCTEKLFHILEEYHIAVALIPTYCLYGQAATLGR